MGDECESSANSNDSDCINTGNPRDERILVRGGHAALAPLHDQVIHSHAEPWLYEDDDGLAERRHWPKGLRNVGNTCYANAALQCLMNTALIDVLLDPDAVTIFRRYSSNHTLLEQGSGSFDSEDSPETRERKLSAREQRRKEREEQRLHHDCEWLTQELKALTLEYGKYDDSQRSSQPSSPHKSTISSPFGWLVSTSKPFPEVVNPGSITKYPNRLSRCLRPYQQEDAHEFLRALLATLVMNGRNRKLSSLFDGLLESAVTCQTCRRPSLTRDRYMDLSLDIKGDHIVTLSDALGEFTKTETLSDDNKVFCQKCDTKRTVTKGLRLATAPTILVCHFKRFAFDMTGRLVRLHKRVKFPLRLEIGDFMSRVNKSRPPPYELVAVLVHQGKSCDSGHYLSYVKSGGDWFRCNDCQVHKVDVQTVLDQQAYILMYEVAGMREKHGYPSPNKSPRSIRRVNSDGETEVSGVRSSSSRKRSISGQHHPGGSSCFSSSLSNIFCGLDETLLQFCQTEPHPTDVILEVPSPLTRRDHQPTGVLSEVPSPLTRRDHQPTGVLSEVPSPRTRRDPPLRDEIVASLDDTAIITSENATKARFPRSNSSGDIFAMEVSSGVAKKKGQNGAVGALHSSPSDRAGHSAPRPCRHPSSDLHRKSDDVLEPPLRRNSSPDIGLRMKRREICRATELPPRRDRAYSRASTAGA